MIKYLRDMKRRLFYYLLMLLPLGLLATACDGDDDNIPDVGVQATISGGVFDNDEIYVVKGEALNVDALTLVNRSGKEGTLGAVTYYWDHYLIGTSIAVPYGLTIDTADQPVGRHLLQAQMPIYVVDHPICYGYIQYYVNIVESASDLPGGSTGGDDTGGDDTGDSGNVSQTKVVNGIIKAKE